MTWRLWGAGAFLRGKAPLDVVSKRRYTVFGWAGAEGPCH